jgi:hypothetical protein
VKYGLFGAAGGPELARRLAVPPPQFVFAHDWRARSSQVNPTTALKSQRNGVAGDARTILVASWV